MNHPNDQRTATPRPHCVDSVVVLQTPDEAVPVGTSGHQRMAEALEEAQREITTLKAGLEGRTLIGEAIGIIMIQDGITADAAFARLIHQSQHTNVKLRDIAKQIVKAADEQAAMPVEAMRLQEP